MRVPSIGEPLDERRIVREAYRIAEHMMRDYREPPGLSARLAMQIANCRQMLLDIYRGMVRS